MLATQSITSPKYVLPPTYESPIHQTIQLVKNVLRQVSCSPQDLKMAFISLLSLPEPSYSLTGSLECDQTAEFYQVSAKRVVFDKDPRKYAMIKAWEKGRLQRWWIWHDEQLIRLQEQEQQRLRRRHFLAKLQTHPWMLPNTLSKIETPTLTMHEQKRLKRQELLRKLTEPESVPCNNLLTRQNAISLIRDSKRLTRNSQEILKRPSLKVAQLRLQSERMHLTLQLESLIESNPSIAPKLLRKYQSLCQ